MQSQISFPEDGPDLSRFDSLYRNESATEAFVPNGVIPDGRYEVTVEDVILTTAQSSGNPMVRWTLRITGSTFRGRILRKYRAITEKTIPFVRRELECCGLQLEQFSDLKYRVSEMLGRELEIVRVTKGEDVNIYFNRAITAQSQPDGMADDELPF